MARQRQQGQSTKRKQHIQTAASEIAATSSDRDSQRSLVDALNATQQYTVPVLPSHPRADTLAGAQDALPYEPDAADPRPRATGNPALASRIEGVNGAGARLTGLGGTLAAPQSPLLDIASAQATVVGVAVRHATSEATTREVGSDEEDANIFDTPGRPTFILPAITNATLPAAIRPRQTRDVAVREAETVQPVLIRGAKRPPMPRLALAPRRSEPRPFVTQFLVAMVTVMTLFAVMTLVTPLGKGAPLSSTFQAYSYSVPWIPTPTPTPSPTPVPQFYGQQRGVNPGQQVIINTINAVFGPYSAGALNIARCESGYDPNAFNSYPVAGSHAEGVFQILYPSTWNGTSYSQYSPYDYNANIRAAYEIFHNDGNSWREWECRP